MNACGKLSSLVRDVKLSCLMFADDLVLLSSSASGLQCALDKLDEYCKVWQLSVNLSKTKVIVFNKGGHQFKRFSFTYNGSMVDIVNEYCYLGIVFSSSGTFKAAAANITDRARRALFKLKQYDVRSNVALSLKLFDSLVMPVIRYGSEVWSIFATKGLNDSNFLKLCDSTVVEKIHVQFCKYLLGVGKKSSNAGVRAELGRHAILPELLAHSAKFWLRLCNHDPSSLVYKAYLDMHSDKTDGNNWADGIKRIWSEFGLGGIWENQGSRYRHKSIKLLKQNMVLRYEHHWLAQVGLSPTFGTVGTKLRSYIQVKHVFGLENYLVAEKNFKRRQHMAKLRISSHPLRIESGRYCRPPLPRESRICQYCNLGVVEDEEHFLIDCTLYNDERAMLFDALRTLVPNIDMLKKLEKFILLLSLNNGDVEFVEPVLKFVSACFDKRAECV